MSTLGKILIGIATFGAIACASGPIQSGTPAHAAMSAAIDRCHTDELWITPAGSSAGAGHIGILYRVRNKANHSCDMYGYPGAQLLDVNKHALPTTVIRGPGFLSGHTQPTTVRLDPGSNAYFALVYAQIPTGTESCSVSHYLLITPPDERTPLFIPAGLTHVCGGRLTATPIEPTRANF